MEVSGYIIWPDHLASRPALEKRRPEPGSRLAHGDSLLARNRASHLPRDPVFANGSRWRPILTKLVQKN